MSKNMQRNLLGVLVLLILGINFILGYYDVLSTTYHWVIIGVIEYIILVVIRKKYLPETFEK